MTRAEHAQRANAPVAPRAALPSRAGLENLISEEVTEGAQVIGRPFGSAVIGKWEVFMFLFGARGSPYQNPF